MACGYVAIGCLCGVDMSLWLWGSHISVYHKGNLEEVVTFFVAKGHLSMCNSELTYEHIGRSFIPAFQ